MKITVTEYISYNRWYRTIYHVFTYHEIDDDGSEYTKDHILSEHKNSELLLDKHILDAFPKEEAEKIKAEWDKTAGAFVYIPPSLDSGDRLVIGEDEYDSEDAYLAAGWFWEDRVR